MFSFLYSGDTASQWRVILGTSLASSGGTEFAVTDLVNHEGYNSATIHNDVAIIRLATPAVYGPTIGVARIPGSNFNIPAGTSVHSIGWGTTSVSV